MPDLSNNYMTADSKCPDDSTADDSIKINLADNYDEVRGFGQPIPIGLAKLMAKNYWEAFDEVQKLLKSIDQNEDGRFNSIKQDGTMLKQFEKLQMMMDPDKHIVSGVFGKEIILQTLAQKNCEGIRYIVGRDTEDKMTVILAGVKETEYPVHDDNYTQKDYKGSKIAIRKSELLPSADYIKQIQEGQASNPKDPDFPEVHLNSLTVADLKATLNKDPDLYSDENDVLFGEF